jgi:hypothetical protein
LNVESIGLANSYSKEEISLYSGKLQEIHAELNGQKTPTPSAVETPSIPHKGLIYSYITDAAPNFQKFGVSMVTGELHRMGVCVLKLENAHEFIRWLIKWYGEPPAVGLAATSTNKENCK